MLSTSATPPELSLVVRTPRERIEPLHQGLEEILALLQVVPQIAGVGLGDLVKLRSSAASYMPICLVTCQLAFMVTP